MADNNEIAAEMEERSTMTAFDGPVISTADDQRPATDGQCSQQQQPVGLGSQRRTSTDPTSCASTHQPQSTAGAASVCSGDDIQSEEVHPVSVGGGGLSEEVSGKQSLGRPDEEAANDVGFGFTQESTRSSGEEESSTMTIQMPADSNQGPRTADGIETTQVGEDGKRRSAHDLLMAAAGCELSYVGSNQKPGVGQTVILFDPSKDLISRGSLADCMFFENSALSSATAANILFIRNVHRVNSHPLDSLTGSATIVCANDASQLALLSNNNAGCQFELGSVDLCGSQTSSDALQLSTSRKSDRLRAKPVGWKAWKNRGSDEWIDLQDGLPFKRKRKASSRLPSAQEDEEDEDKLTNLEETIVCRRSVDPDKTCSRPEGNGDLAKSEAASQVLLAPAAAAAVASSSLRTYTCTTCSKDFTTEKYLSMHMSLHSGSNYASSVLLQPTAGLGISGCGGTADLPIRRTKATSPGSMSQWTCKICEKTFAQNSNYKNHIRTHSNERPFVCEICSIGFKERYHLKKHVLFKHTTQLNEKCRFCEKCFKDSTAVRAHERTHSDQRPYACTRCEKTFKTSECLWHHENRSKTCGKSLGDLPFQANLPSAGSGQKPRRGGRQTQPSEPRQQLSVGAIPPPATVTPSVQLMVSADPVQPTAAVCEESTEETVVRKSDTVASWSVASGIRSDGSGRAMAGDGGIGERTTAEGRVPADREGGGGVGGEGPIPAVKVEMEMSIFDYDLTGIATSDSSLEEYCEDLEEREEDDDDYDYDDASVAAPDRTKCDEMSALCYQKQQQLLMQQQQQQQQPQLSSRGRLDCIRCGKQCSTQSAYEKHCIVHSEARPHRCDECDIGFKLKVHLKKHNLYRHSNEYPCECSICGKRFKDSSAVRLHERIHSTERPFKCHCGKGFKTRENLWGHRHRGPCDKSDDFLLQNPRVFNSDIGPIWGVPLNMMNAHTMANDIKPQEFSAPTVLHHLHQHQQQQQQGYPKDVLTSLAGASSSTTLPNQRPGLTTSSQLFKKEMTPGTTSHESSSSSTASPSSSSIAKFTVSGSRAIAIACSGATTASGGGAGVPYPPTAVVVPIKREVVDVSKSDGGQGPVVVNEKCSLPPFETLVTTHRPSPLTSSVDGVGSSEAATAAAVHVPGRFARPSIADRCPTVQKILLMNGPPAKVRVRLPGIQQLFQTHSVGGAGALSAAAAAAAVTEATDDDDRGIPADLSYHNLFGVAMSSPSPVSTSSPIVLSGTDFVCENRLHQVQKHQHQQPTNAQAPAGLVYLHGAEFCLPPPPPYPGLTSFSSAGVNAAKSSEAEQQRQPLSSCASVVYWAGDRGEEAFTSTDGGRKNSSALSWPPSSSSPSSEPESLLLGDCSISSRFGCF